MSEPCGDDESADVGDAKAECLGDPCQAYAGQRVGERLCCRASDVELLLSEKDPGQHAALMAALSADGHVLAHPPVLSAFEDALPGMLKVAGAAPAFFFVDPYGLGVPFDDVVTIMNRPRGATTEVCLNFSANGVRRIGGRLREPEDAPGRAKTLEKLDRACGGMWWREVWSAAATPEAAAKAIVRGVAKRLAEKAGSGYWIIDVRKSPTRQPEYHLVFLTRHEDGLVVFGDAVSHAQAEWRAIVIPEDLLSDLDENQLAEGWVDEIEQNVRRLLSKGPFSAGDKYPEIMGAALGYAREMHVRKAMKRLYVSGEQATEPKGKIFKLYVRPGS